MVVVARALVGRLHCAVLACLRLTSLVKGGVGTQCCVSQVESYRAELLPC
jgi:hypothetical protein